MAFSAEENAAIRETLDRLLDVANRDTGQSRRVADFLVEAVLARAASLDLNEVGRREHRAHEGEVEDVRAVVAGGHHADGDADARLAGLVGVEEVCGAEQVVVGEVDGVLLGDGPLLGHKPVPGA